jgi:NifU-like protein involved in Fe-S cluster formation
VIYSDLTLRYFETAPGAGILSGPCVYRGAAGSRAQGTWVQFDIEAADGTIGGARFLAFACPHTIAAAGWIVEYAPGLAVRPELPVSVADLSERFAVPTEKRGRLLIIEDAWVAAMTAALRG